MDDLISRQAALDAVEKYDFNFPKYMERFVTELRDAMKEDLKGDIADLPSARPKRKTCGLECLRCKQTYEYSWDTMDEISYTMYSYCPACIRKGIQLLKSQDKKGA